MNEEWKNIEGSEVRIDVGSTSEEAMNKDMPAGVICFTTDKRIILNGEEFAPQQNLIDEAIRDTYPMVINCVNAEGGIVRNKLPQILCDPTELTQDEISDFFNVYPFDTLVDCYNKGKQLHAVYNSKTHSKIYNLIFTSLVNFNNKTELSFRWQYGDIEYHTIITKIGDSVSISRKQTSHDIQNLVEEIERLKYYLTLA